ncbi:MAG: hypothetical protein KA105_00930 [Caulobacter sp.]|jgi:hypothetical protein|nr:hypothetical protein [Caulobacter sp.]
MRSIVLTAALVLSGLGLAACEKTVEPPYDRGVCFHMGAQPDGTYKFNVVARNVDSIEKCAAQLEGMRLRFLRMGGTQAEMVGAYQGSFLFLKRGGVYRSSGWKASQYILLVRSGDGRLIQPGAVQYE